MQTDHSQLVLFSIANSIFRKTGNGTWNKTEKKHPHLEHSKKVLTTCCVALDIAFNSASMPASPCIHRSIETCTDDGRLVLFYATPTPPTWVGECTDTMRMDAYFPEAQPGLHHFGPGTKAPIHVQSNLKKRSGGDFSPISPILCSLELVDALCSVFYHNPS